MGYDFSFLMEQKKAVPLKETAFGIPCSLFTFSDQAL